MRIGILGAGNMADALGAQWARAGHDVLIGARSPAKASALAGRIGARAGSLTEAAGFGEATLVAVRHEGLPGLLDQAGGPLRGRTVLDCVNAIVPPGAMLATGGGPPVARLIAERTGANVVKAFNLCHDSVWRRRPPHFGGRPLAVPICGDDATALATTRSLVRDLGCEPVDAGGLDRAGLLEAAAAFAIGLYLGGGDPRSVFPPVEYAGAAPNAGVHGEPS
jgi:8-hydroxy-5-deazaflavin:NADPH oxidoreductase